MRLLTPLLLLIGCLLAAPRALAHDPFDISCRATVKSDRIEIVSTLGMDAARWLLEAEGSTPQQTKSAMLNFGPRNIVTHSEEIARILFELEAGGRSLPVKSAASLSNGDEFILTLTYPRPDSGAVLVRAVCYQRNQSLRAIPWSAIEESGTRLGASLFSATDNELTVKLPPAETSRTEPNEEPVPAPAVSQNDGEGLEAGPVASPRGWTFFKLGVEHILIGIDHLLFLAVLLMGVKRLPGMLAVITCFTIAHSITLGLAALGLVTFPSRVIEPLIAASIIVVGLCNFLPSKTERKRWWLAGGFGLLHGFGFAAVLRETGLAQEGTGLVLPLLAFNAGVEVGQIALAAVFLPVLFLIRRWPRWRRYGSPLVSCGVIAISAHWLWQRVFLG